MNVVFSVLIGASLLFLLLSGGGDGAFASLIAGANDAVAACLSMCGAYLLWMGLLNVAKEAGLMRALARILKPVLRLLFPHAGKAGEAISMNLAANMLGMGNAATPYGIEAMRLLNEANPRPGVATNEMCVLICINASCLELFPASLIALRQSYGSVQPLAVVVPSLLASLAATLVAAVLCLFCIRPCRSQSQSCC